MVRDFLLDTNIVIGLFANDLAIQRKISQHPSAIYVPSIVLGELFYGAEQSTRKEENRSKIDAFAKISSIVECDLGTAMFYGKIKNQLKMNGTPIPENDIWIAAIAQQRSLALVTRDKHFKNIIELPIENW
jgi:tRNA(fMet)-specific endonuclease VapC